MATLTRCIVVTAILALSSTWLVPESLSAQEQVALNRKVFATHVKTNNDVLLVGAAGKDGFSETLFSCPTVGTTCTIRGEITVYLPELEQADAFYACILLNNNAGDCGGGDLSTPPASVWPSNVLYFTRFPVGASYGGARTVSFMKTGLAGGQIHSIKVKLYSWASVSASDRVLTIDVYRP